MVLIDVVADEENDFAFVVLNTGRVDDKVAETSILIEVNLELFSPSFKKFLPGLKH